MKLRNITISIICLVIAVSSIYYSSTKINYINSQRKEMRLISNEPLENAPPSLAFATVAMGAFRGLLVDILWIRADSLKEKGQFFDAKQLADWITVLQPRFASVWEFQAWNMAYNISVTFPASQPAERWRWVRNGYELIRDKGLEKNPHSIILYRQLAWIFQHKMGGVTDDVHRYYKLQLAIQMEDLLSKKFTNETFTQLQAAPKTFEQLTQDANFINFISDLQKTDARFEDMDTFCDNYLALRRGPGNFDPNAFNVIDDYLARKDNLLGRFNNFAKAYQLRNQWKLDIDLMINCNNLYGPVVGNDSNDPNYRDPLNWKHPDSHAIYWANKGLEIAGNDEKSTDELNADRIIFHSLQSLYRTGLTFIYDQPVEIDANSLPPGTQLPLGQKKVTTVKKEIFLRPDLRIFDSYNQATLQRIDKYSDHGRTRVQSLENGHRNMLKNAVLSFYQAGQRSKAREIYNQLRELYGKERKELQVSLIQFCRARIVEELSSIGITDAREMVVLMLREAYFLYAVGQDEQSLGREKAAIEIYEKYQKEFDDEGVDRVTLPPFAKLRFVGLLDFLNDSYYPPKMKELLFNRIKIDRPKLYKKLEQQSKIIQQEIQKNQENN